VPSDLAAALRSPMLALLTAVTTSEASLAADKSTLDPFILNDVLNVG
jgi:hypothetical protein